MNPQKLSRVVTWCITVSLLLSATFGILVCDRASAKSGNNQAGNNQSNNDSRNADKVSSDLRTEVGRAQRHKKDNNNNEDVKVILQFNGPVTGELNALLNSNGVKVRKRFRNFSSNVVELPASIVEQLAAF